MGGQSFVQSMTSMAIYPLVFTIGVLTLGWFYERLTALILALGAVGTLTWGVIMQWEPAVWMIMIAFFVTPTVIAAVLFYLAGNEPSTDPQEAKQPNAGAHA
jgi:fatty acid desaturase